jgi:hypothetical protein
MFPAASAVTAGSGSVAASACWPWAVASAVTGAGWLASAVLPAGSASGCPGSAVLLAPGVSAGGASPPVASGAAAGVQVSALPGLLPLIRVAVPFFSCAIRACRAAAVLIPARAAMTATAAPQGSADRAARTAAAGLSPAAGATGGGRGRRGVGGAAGRVRGGVLGACHDGDSVSYSPALFRFSFACADVFWTTIALVRT